jgi:hypothetical protein
MFTRSSIAALLAVAVVGTAALAPTSASAFMPSGPKPHYMPKVPLKPIHFPTKPLKPIIPIHPIHPVHPPHVVPPIVWHPHHRHVWWVKWHRPHYIAQPVVTTVSAPVVQRVAAPCNCLTKEYLPDGGILFKDLCTKEEAMATPDELKAQAQAPGPQVH